MAKSPLSEPERFWRNVSQPSVKACWTWQGSKDGNGYGHFRLCSGRLVHAHRLAYFWIVGPVPEGKDLHHTCNRGREACMNPFHLEPLTRKEHIHRGNGIAAINARKTHCIRGHPLSGYNLVIDRTGGRQCRTCLNATRRRYRANCKMKHQKTVQTIRADTVSTNGDGDTEEESD